MKRLVLGVLVVGLLGLGAPMASAADRYHGGCGFDTVNTVAQPQDEFTGVLSVAIVAIDSTTAAPLLVEGECWVQVDGVAQPGTVLGFSGRGVVAGATTITYTASLTSFVELCESFTYGSTTESNCGHFGDPFPPDEVVDLLEDVFTLLTDLLRAGDGTICPILVDLGIALNGGLDGLLEIDAEGDVRVVGELVWDCPPYES